MLMNSPHTGFQRICPQKRPCSQEEFWIHAKSPMRSSKPISPGKSARLQMSLGNVVGFVTRLLDDHWHSGSELPAPFSGNYGTPFVREADYSAMCSAFHSR